MGVTVSLMMTYAEGPAAAAGAGAYNAIGNALALLGPILLGVIYDSTGSYEGAFFLMGALVIAAGIMGFLAPKTKYEKTL